MRRRRLQRSDQLLAESSLIWMDFPEAEFEDGLLPEQSSVAQRVGSQYGRDFQGRPEIVSK